MEELEHALSHLFSNYEDPLIVVLGDFNQIGMKKFKNVLKDYGLKSIFEN